MTRTLDKAGRIVVPKAIRDRFALAPGAEMEMEVTGAGIHLRPLTAGSCLTQKGGILVCTSDLPVEAWDLPRFMDGEREARARQIGDMGG